jgi:glyoxalase-like protein
VTRFDRQTPERDQIYLDHVGWFVTDVEQASRTFERLGFVLTPFVVSRNADPADGTLKPSGTGNRCAMLHRGYLELIAAIDGVDTPLARQHRQAVRRHLGVHVVAFTVPDARAAHRRLSAEGFDPGEPVRLRRPIRAEDGSERHAEFTVIRVPPQAMPEGRIQILTQETPDLIWQPSLLASENGIRRLTGVLVCVEDPDEAARRFGRFTGRAPAGPPDCRLIDLDRGRLAFARPESAGRLLATDVPGPAPAVAAVGLASADVAETARFLEGRGLAVERAGGTVRIAPQDALGAALVVHDENDSWPPGPAPARAP